MITPEAELEIGLGILGAERAEGHMPPIATSHTTSVCDSVAANPSRMACRTVPFTAMMKAAIMVLECPGSSPWRPAGWRWG
jgi:hypothetical protein